MYITCCHLRCFNKAIFVCAYVRFESVDAFLFAIRSNFKKSLHDSPTC